MSAAAYLNRAWLRRGWLPCALWPLSMLMRGLVAARRLGYQRGWLKSVKLPVPLLVVGNRVAGGAGKTPTTIALLQYLQAQGWRPGVLTRGYKAQAVGPGPLLLDATSAGHLHAGVTGDEPLLIWRRTSAPIMIGRDRAASGRALLASHPEIDLLVCDDGLQHLRLQRDVEVVVFDERGAGNGWLLPAGPLREPIDVAPASTLRAKPIVLYNASKPSTPLPGHLAKRGMAPLQTLEDWWQGAMTSARLDPSGAARGRAPSPPPKSVVAVAGIAQPERFFRALSATGVTVHQGISLDDHADFATLPWPPDVRHVVVTEKDAVKLTPERVAAERPGCQVWVAALDFQPEDNFWTTLDAALPPAVTDRRFA